jgi:hypothetical protein
MKYFLLILLIAFAISCTTVKHSSCYKVENQLINTRRYIGEFIDYCHTGPEIFGGTNLIWIKTTVYNSYGKLSAFGSQCDFNPGDKLYLRRLYATPGTCGNWAYQVENDSLVYYRLSEYRYENNVLVQAMF